jgi:hypothetical protein
MSGWQTHATRTVYENAWVRVREDTVTRPDGSEGVYGVTEMKHPAVFVVPVTEAGEVLLVLLEETGRSAATWTRLGEFFSLNGVADARADVFLAQHLTGDGAGHDAAAEGISGLLLVPWAEAMDLVRCGAIHDNESIAALTLAGLELGHVR